MTAEVKDELSRLMVNSVSARKAEVSALLRFAGGLHIVAGRVIVEAEVDLGIIARRLRKDIFDLYGYNAIVHVLSASGIRKNTRYVVRVAKDGEALARQTGLLDLRGRPVRGLPVHVVGGSVADVEAAWRGAFLAHGSLTEPGRSGTAVEAADVPAGFSRSPKQRRRPRFLVFWRSVGAPSGRRAVSPTYGRSASAVARSWLRAAVWGSTVGGGVVVPVGVLVSVVGVGVELGSKVPTRTSIPALASASV